MVAGVARPQCIKYVVSDTYYLFSISPGGSRIQYFAFLLRLIFFRENKDFYWQIWLKEFSVVFFFPFLLLFLFCYVTWKSVVRRP